MDPEPIELRLIKRGPMQRYAYYVEQFESRSREIRKGRIKANIRAQTVEYSGTNLEALAVDLLKDHKESLAVLEQLCKAVLSYVEISFRWRPWNVWAQGVLRQMRVFAVHRSLLLYGLGRHEAEMGQLDSSIATHLAALEEANKLTLSEALNLRGLGIAYQLKGIWSGAQDALQRAVRLLEQLDEPYYLAVTMANMASYYYRKGEYEPAMEWYQKTLSTYDTLGDNFLADNTWYSIGWVDLNEKRLTDAFNCFTKCLELSKARSERIHEYGLGNYGMGTALYRMHRFEESVVALEEALSIFRNEANVVMQGFTCQVLADAHRKLGNYADAQQALDRALQLHQETDHIVQFAYIYLKRAKLRLDRGVYEEAISECDLAVQAARRSRRRDLYLAACICRLEACLRTYGQSESVLILHKKYMKMAMRQNDVDAFHKLQNLLE